MIDEHDAIVERIARAICRERHPCDSMVFEIMSEPDYQAGYEGDAARITQAGELRSYARAALRVISDETSLD